MALSMEEQRILAEIEDQLTRSEPVLAARLASLSPPSLTDVLCSARVRRLATVGVVAALVVVSVVVYALASLRGIPHRGGPGRPTAAPGHPVMTVPHVPAARAAPPGRPAVHPPAPRSNHARSRG